MQVRVWDIFQKNRRFDLIFKYLYLKNHRNCCQLTNFYEELYCEHIRAFNNFKEHHPSDGIPKESRADFIQAFNRIYDDIREHGFDAKKSIAPIDTHFELVDAAHRVAACMCLNQDIWVQEVIQDAEEIYDYAFFRAKEISPFYADYAALEYVKLQQNAYIVNLHSVTDPALDSTVEKILCQYGFIYYKKNIKLTFSGYVNLKKMSYGNDIWDGPPWIGTIKNSFAGAQEHAKKSMGKNPLRAYVFVCDSLDKVVAAKAEIRKFFGIGNHSVHVNDNREEALRLAETFFNESSLWALNTRSFILEDEFLIERITELKKITRDKGVSLDEICAAGSSPLSVFGIRQSRDLDFLYSGNKEFVTNDPFISNHKSEAAYYPYNVVEQVVNPAHYFYYEGMKFITLNVLRLMKAKRNEVPKDIEDCRLIDTFVARNGKAPFIFFKKEKFGRLRKITAFGLTFTYQKAQKKNQD